MLLFFYATLCSHAFFNIFFYFPRTFSPTRISDFVLKKFSQHFNRLFAYTIFFHKRCLLLLFFFETLRFISLRFVSLHKVSWTLTCFACSSCSWFFYSLALLESLLRYGKSFHAQLFKNSLHAFRRATNQAWLAKLKFIPNLQGSSEF